MVWRWLCGVRELMKVSSFMGFLYYEKKGIVVAHGSWKVKVGMFVLVFHHI